MVVDLLQVAVAEFAGFGDPLQVDPSLRSGQVFSFGLAPAMTFLIPNITFGSGIGKMTFGIPGNEIDGPEPHYRDPRSGFRDHESDLPADDEAKCSNTMGTPFLPVPSAVRSMCESL